MFQLSHADARELRRHFIWFLYFLHIRASGAKQPKNKNHIRYTHCYSLIIVWLLDGSKRDLLYHYLVLRVILLHVSTFWLASSDMIYCPMWYLRLLTLIRSRVLFGEDNGRFMCWPTHRHVPLFLMFAFLCAATLVISRSFSRTWLFATEKLHCKRMFTNTRLWAYFPEPVRSSISSGLRNVNQPSSFVSLYYLSFLYSRFVVNFIGSAIYFYNALMASFMILLCSATNSLKLVSYNLYLADLAFLKALSP